ncbi:MAG: hypothetical protein IJW77_06305 [Clostridia bacterium]|nr:hypothetical protein [Clostridia bacterium]
MLPVAKSTEAFFLNKTLFDRFSANTGITTDALRSYDGIFSAARAYYDWSDGHNFLQINDYYHYAYVGMKAHGIGSYGITNFSFFLQISIAQIMKI